MISWYSHSGIFTARRGHSLAVDILIFVWILKVMLQIQYISTVSFLMIIHCSMHLNCEENAFHNLHGDRYLRKVSILGCLMWYQNDGTRIVRMFRILSPHSCIVMVSKAFKYSLALSLLFELCSNFEKSFMILIIEKFAILSYHSIHKRFSYCKKYRLIAWIINARL